MSYSNINTFDGGEYKRDVRQNILNPLITQHNMIKNKVVDHDSRLSTVEDVINNGGGSGGGDVNLGPLTARVRAVEDDMVTVQSDVADHSSRLTDLESGGSVGPSLPGVIKKWYVLPMGGQSNCVGYGETPYDIQGVDGPNPRIMQVGRYSMSDSSQSDLVIKKSVLANYGDLLDTLRPKNDCNLEIIPATPCLDFSQNMFQHNASHGGGTVSSGMYIARMLLPYIPSDYGILIVPCAYGGTGFTSGANGSWNQAKLRGEGAKKHGADLPLAKDFYYRTKFALELNPSNKLLPYLWIQGENDQGNYLGHYTGFKAFFEWFKDKFEADGLHKHLPEGRMDDFRWFCLSSTKWMVGANTETDYIHWHKDWELNSVPNRLGPYNNYAMLSNKYKTSNGESQLVYIRTDIDKHGNFVETNREYGTGNTTSTRQIHFSTRGFSKSMPEIVVNAILRHTNLFPQSGVTYTRPIAGGIGMTTTDGVVYSQPVGVDFSKINDGLLVHQDFGASTTPADNQVSGSTATVASGTAITLVEDPQYGKVAHFPGGNSQSKIAYACGKGATSYTKTLTIRNSSEAGYATHGWVSSGITDHSQGLFIAYKNSYIFYPNYTSAYRNSSLIAAAALEGNWNGGFNDWNHITMAWSKEAKVAMLYLNGQLVHSSPCDAPCTLNTFYIGTAVSNSNSANQFIGDIANTRVYDRMLSHEEIRGLYHIDMPDCSK